MKSSWSEFDRLQRQMDEAFWGVINPWNKRTLLPKSTEARGFLETEGAYVVTRNIPGVSKEDILLNIGPDGLHLEIKQHKEQFEGLKLTYQERTGPGFTETIRFAKAVDGDAIEANYSDGVLTLTVPKSAAFQPRKIQVGSREAS